MGNWGSAFYTSCWHFCYLAEADYTVHSVTRGPESVLSAGNKYVAMTDFCDGDEGCLAVMVYLHWLV